MLTDAGRARILTLLRATGPAAVARGASLIGAQGELIEKLDALRRASLAYGIDFHIANFGGLRTEEQTRRILEYRRQDWAVATAHNPQLARDTTMEKWRRIAPWGSSLHNYGAAADLEIDHAPPGMSFAAALAKVRQLAPGVGLSLIADDWPHVQLAGGLALQKVRYYAATGRDFFGGFTSLEILGVLVALGLVILLYAMRS